MGSLQGLRDHLSLRVKLMARDDERYTLDELIVAHGVAFTGPGEPLTVAEYMLIGVAANQWDGFAVKECFFNAQRLSHFTDQRLRYFEGYAVGPAAIPVYHAWVVTKSGKVIDLTWRQRGEVDRDPEVTGPWVDRYAVGTMPEQAVYLGVEIDVEGAIARMCEREECNPYLDDWMAQWPLLKRERWDK
jgi:hypothetical protein